MSRMRVCETDCVGSIVRTFVFCCCISALLLPGGIPQYLIVYYLLYAVLWVVDRLRRV